MSFIRRCSLNKNPQNRRRNYFHDVYNALVVQINGLNRPLRPPRTASFPVKHRVLGSNSKTETSMEFCATGKLHKASKRKIRVEMWNYCPHPVAVTMLTHSQRRKSNAAFHKLCKNWRR